MSSVLKTKDLQVVHRLNPMSLTFQSGSLIAIIGPNGSGKSTFLQAISGLLSYDGEVIWNGFNLNDIPVYQRAQQLAWVGPEPNFQFPFTVQEVLRMGRFARGEDSHNLEPYLKDMDLVSLADRPITQISTGEKQRTLLARAMVTQAPIQCWDEPLSSLDIRHQLEILMKARAMANAGATILISLHDLRVAHCMDQVVLLDQGNLIACGSPAQVLTPALLRQVFGVLSRESMGLVLELPPK
ncbi:MAG: hypothetical protein SGVNAXEH_000026 [Holophagaceae bacterium]|jgi:iron complex transport system ATP-binding protein|nr:ABC transporter ATP-binding protein [Acidobacteriota bacterium]